MRNKQRINLVCMLLLARAPVAMNNKIEDNIFFLITAPVIITLVNIPLNELQILI